MVDNGLDDPLDFDHFHRAVLPARLGAGNGALAVEDARKIGPLAIRTSAGTFTYVPAGDTIEIVEGDDGAKTVIALDDESWQGLVRDLDTPPGLLYGGRVETVRGNPLRFVRWEPALRAMYHGRPVYDPARGSTCTASTRPPRSRCRTSPRNPKAFATSSTRADTSSSATCSPPPKSSASSKTPTCWATRPPRATRCPGGAATSTVRWCYAACRAPRARPRLRALHRDPRVLALADLAPVPVSAKRKTDNDGVTVLWKRPQVTEGLADLPWHRDCGMGGHALNCPGFVLTICLTDGSAAAGELRALPGSHHMTHPTIDGTEADAPRGMSLAVTAGDVSFHYSDVLHASMPPTSVTGPHRISVLLGFSPEGGGHHRGERHYNDVLLSRDDGLVPHLVDHVGRRRDATSSDEPYAS